MWFYCWKKSTYSLRLSKWLLIWWMLSSLCLLLNDHYWLFLQLPLPAIKLLNSSCLLQLSTIACFSITCDIILLHYIHNFLNWGKLANILGCFCKTQICSGGINKSHKRKIWFKFPVISYEVANTFSSFRPFSNSSIGYPVISPMGFADQ